MRNSSVTRKRKRWDISEHSGIVLRKSGFSRYKFIEKHTKVLETETTDPEGQVAWNCGRQLRE